MKNKVLVTGGLGFIGSHFVELLLEKGYEVTNIDKITYASNINFRPASPHYRLIQEDVKDLDSLPPCDYIVHFAAESHVDNSIANSDPFMQSNVLGTHNLLELLRKSKIEDFKYGWEHTDPIFIYIGTDEVFGDIENGFFLEDDRHNPSNPYSASKSCAEMLVKAWGRTYGLPYRITRTTNNYGERQFPEKLVPRCIKSCLTGQKIPIQGTGEYVRNWIYVKDNCEAILRVMESGKNGETYHISSNEEYSVVEIVKGILFKFKLDFDKNVEFVANRTGQDVRYALDNSKIKRELGWEPKHYMWSVLDKIIESYK
jgi:dTDP-glucose 4,6-dehydratase